MRSALFIVFIFDLVFYYNKIGKILIIRKDLYRIFRPLKIDSLFLKYGHDY
jgi:hypothetical protein